MSRGFMSIDAESDGLWGNIFSVAAIVYDNDGVEVDKILLRLPSAYVNNEWVKEHVLPNLDFAPTHTDYTAMLKDFAAFYTKYQEEYRALYHMGHIIESYLFRELRNLNLIGDFDAPYVPVEVSMYLDMIGERADSVDAYVIKYNVRVEYYGRTHNPLYDCVVAYRVYKHIIDNIEFKKRRVI